MSTEKNYLTRQGYEAMRTELAQLIKVERPSVVQIVSWAASNGDRSLAAIGRAGRFLADAFLDHGC